MIVRELIERLSVVDPDRVVVMSRDPEGNGFSLLADIGLNSYNDGEIGLEEIDDEDREMGYTDEDLLDGEPAVVLWPT